MQSEWRNDMKLANFSGEFVGKLTKGIFAKTSFGAIFIEFSVVAELEDFTAFTFLGADIFPDG